MRTISIDSSKDGKRIDRVIRELFPNMPVNAMYKAFRKKDVKVNGIRIKDGYIVSAGDKVEIFIIDSILEGKSLQQDDSTLNKGFTVVYEDKNILIANKEQGVPVHPDREQSDNTLIDYVRSYLEEKGEYEPKSAASSPALCHRLDRNTGGLIIIAKNNESLEIILEKIKTKEIKKYYLCKVTGKMPKPKDELRAYLEKDERKSRVFIHDSPARNSLEIITRYKVLSYENDISLLEVELVTGRTHQIRAHLAYVGHPIIGDGKYGLNSVNRSMKEKYQALWAYKLVFDFSNAGHLSYLKGKVFEVRPEM